MVADAPERGQRDLAEYGYPVDSLQIQRISIAGVEEFQDRDHQHRQQKRERSGEDQEKIAWREGWIERRLGP